MTVGRRVQITLPIKASDNIDCFGNADAKTVEASVLPLLQRLADLLTWHVLSAQCSTGMEH